MKRLFFAAMAIAAFVMTGCSKDDGEGVPNGGELVGGIYAADGTAMVASNKQDCYITKDLSLPKGTYSLKGWVRISNGCTLTIAPGTIIKGDKPTKATLIAERGGRLVAEGTKTSPIVFTSAQPAGQRRPGDWGGLILCGNARNNQGLMEIEGGVSVVHGGQDDADNSGILRYVRCEFAGYPYVADNEINGITFGSVGSGTQIDHVQVSYSNDDSFEWFGGSVNAKYLIAYHGWDDDFDTDSGFSGKVQFCLGVRHPKVADQSISNGFESDNNGDGSAVEPYTQAIFSNVTFVGPIGQVPNFQNTTTFIDGGGLNPANGSRLGVFQAAMQIRRNSHLSCFNSVAMGFPVGLIVENDKGSQTQQAADAGDLKIANIIFAGMTCLGGDANKADYTQESDATRNSFSAKYFNTASLNNSVYASIADLKLAQPNSMAANPDFRPVAGSPLLNRASFTDAMLTDGFDRVNYVGAFAEGDNWTEGWVEFDPQNAIY